MNEFEKVIKEYLENRAKTDDLFAKSYAKEGKSIKECCNYIIQEVKKTGRQGFADEEIFSMAVHYYDEDNIKVESKTPGCNVVVNKKIEKKIEKPQPKATPQPKPQPTKKEESNLFCQPKEKPTPKANNKPKAKAKAEDDLFVGSLF